MCGVFVAFDSKHQFTKCHWEYQVSANTSWISAGQILGMDLIVAIIGSSLQFVNVFFTRDRRITLTTWERLGVNGPKASSLLLGNFVELMAEGTFKLFRQWTEKYGKVLGFYEGSTPTLAVADPDVVREILIKQFNKFEQRQPLLDNPDLPDAGIFIAKGEKWKRIRGLTTAIFSAKKMKMMSPLVQQSIDKLINIFEQRLKDDKEFDIYKDFKCFTLDVIASTVFSYDTDIFNAAIDHNPFLKHNQKIFDDLNPDKWSFLRKAEALLYFSFPGLLNTIRLFYPRIFDLQYGWLRELSGKMIKDHQSSRKVRPDFIQLMLNSLNQTNGHEFVSHTGTD